MTYGLTRLLCRSAEADVLCKEEFLNKTHETSMVPDISHTEAHKRTIKVDSSRCNRRCEKVK